MIPVIRNISVHNAEIAKPNLWTSLVDMVTFILLSCIIQISAAGNIQTIHI